ncbi:MAG: hypothetical protein EOO65_00100 [Methanosarcinales archaeon]|nr:MAG: hypothetical protein EOO65_00100 [Methanosarcinales archaeon]
MCLHCAAVHSLCAGHADSVHVERGRPCAYSQWLQKPITREWMEVYEHNSKVPTAFINTRTGKRQAEHPNVQACARARRVVQASVEAECEAQVADATMQHDQANKARRRRIIELANHAYIMRKLQQFREPPRRVMPPGMSPAAAKLLRRAESARALHRLRAGAGGGGSPPQSDVSGPQHISRSALPLPSASRVADAASKTGDAIRQRIASLLVRAVQTVSS